MTHTSKRSTTIKPSNLRLEVEKERNNRRGLSDLLAFVESLPEPDKVDWRDMCLDASVQTMQLWRVLKKHGVNIAYSTLARYRERLGLTA